MQLTNRSWHPSGRSAALGGALVLILTTSSMASPSRDGVPPSIASLKRLRGETVAESRGAAPAGPLQITGYRVEKLALPEPARVWIEGRRAETQTAWHVTVFFGRHLTVRDQAFSLVIDGHWCGFLAEAPDLRSADAICFNGALLRNGAALGVTYRTISINQPADEAVSPDAAFDGDEAIHYSSARLQLRGEQ